MRKIIRKRQFVDRLKGDEMGHELHPIMEKALATILNMTDKEDKEMNERIRNACVYGTSHPEIYKEDKPMDKKTNFRDTYLAIIVEEIFTQRGDLKDKYISLRDNFYFSVIEKKLMSLHASFHCDVVGAHNFSMAKKELVETHETSICKTAPYPFCNGANGCDTCEHQPEED